MFSLRICQCKHAMDILEARRLSLVSSFEDVPDYGIILILSAIALLLLSFPVVCYWLRQHRTRASKCTAGKASCPQTPLESPRPPVLTEPPLPSSLPPLLPHVPCCAGPLPPEPRRHMSKEERASAIHMATLFHNDRGDADDHVFLYASGDPAFRYSNRAGPLGAGSCRRQRPQSAPLPSRDFVNSVRHGGWQAAARPSSAPLGRRAGVRPERPSSAPVLQRHHDTSDADVHIVALRRQMHESMEWPLPDRKLLLRAFLRRWHPDKNTDGDKALATAVFQFINANSVWFLAEGKHS